MKTSHSSWIKLSLTGAILMCSFAAAWTYRKVHSGYVSADSFRYFVDLYEGAEAVPAEDALDENSLSLTYGDDEQLLRDVSHLLGTGSGNAATLQLKRIAAILTTFQYDENDDVVQLAIRMFGEQRLDMRNPGFHRDGYFRYMVDDELWNAGNTIIGLLGRDIDLKTPEHHRAFQTGLTRSMFTGELGHILAALNEPHYFILSIPSPRGLLPPELRPHVRSVVLKGHIEPGGGQIRSVFFCKSDRSAKYTKTVVEDMKVGAEAILRNRFGGTVQKTDWGPQVDTWWAHEMVMSSEDMVIKQEENVLSMDSRFGRVMVNAMLKSFERMGRDLQQIKLQMDQRLDPRIADAVTRTQQPRHYWTNPHRWGPNWPIPANGHTEDYHQVLLDLGVSEDIIRAASNTTTNSTAAADPDGSPPTI